MIVVVVVDAAAAFGNDVGEEFVEQAVVVSFDYSLVSPIRLLQTWYAPSDAKSFVMSFERCNLNLHAPVLKVKNKIIIFYI